MKYVMFLFTRRYIKLILHGENLKNLLSIILTKYDIHVIYFITLSTVLYAMNLQNYFNCDQNIYFLFQESIYFFFTV